MHDIDNEIVKWILMNIKLGITAIHSNLFQSLHYQRSFKQNKLQ